MDEQDKNDLIDECGGDARFPMVRREVVYKIIDRVTSAERANDADHRTTTSQAAKAQRQ